MVFIDFPFPKVSSLEHSKPSLPSIDLIRNLYRRPWPTQRCGVPPQRRHPAGQCWQQHRPMPVVEACCRWHFDRVKFCFRWLYIPITWVFKITDKKKKTMQKNKQVPKKNHSKNHMPPPSTNWNMPCSNIFPQPWKSCRKAEYPPRPSTWMKRRQWRR